MTEKFVSDSYTVMTEVVLPNDTNPLGVLLGGRILYWMDIAAAICSQQHTNRVSVTVSVDHLSFFEPVKIGDIVHIAAQVTRTFDTSMEIFVEVWKTSIKNEKKIKTNEAFFTFVAIDDEGKKVQIPVIIPKTKREKMLFGTGLKRRKKRLSEKKSGFS